MTNKKEIKIDKKPRDIIIFTIPWIILLILFSAIMWYMIQIQISLLMANILLLIPLFIVIVIGIVVFIVIREINKKNKV